MWGVSRHPVSPARIIRGLMQHVKHLYGIRMAVRGAQHFPPRQPYVVVSNHQSSLDLLGTPAPRRCPTALPHRPVPCPLCPYLIVSNHQSSFDLPGIPAPRRCRTAWPLVLPPAP